MHKMRIIIQVSLVTLLLFYALVFLLFLPVTILALLTYKEPMQGRTNAPLVILMDVVIALTFLPLTLILALIWAMDMLRRIIISRLKACIWIIYKFRYRIRHYIVHS